MTTAAILDSINAARLRRAPPLLEFYRRDVTVGDPPARLSVYDLGPLAAGAPDLPPLLLLHGFAASSAWWYGVLEALAQRWRILLPDLRGHGRSELTENGHTLAGYTQDLLELLDALGVAVPVSVAGHSAGGMLAVELARRSPQRVAALALIATPARLRRNSLSLPVRMLLRTPEALARLAQPLMAFDPGGRGPASLVGLLRLFPALEAWDAEQALPGLTLPALVVTGHADRVFPRADYAAASRLLPHAEVVDLGSAKHQVPLERPRALARALDRFLLNALAAPALGAPDAAPAWRAENDSLPGIQLAVQRPWLARYDPGVPPVVQAPAAGLHRLLEVAAGRYPRRPALAAGSLRLNYRQWQALVAARKGDGAPPEALLPLFASAGPLTLFSAQGRAVSLPQEALAANALQLRLWLGLEENGGAALSALPWWRPFGLVLGVLLPLAAGLQVVATPASLAAPGSANPSAELDTLLRLAQRHRPALFSASPQVYIELIDHPDLARSDGGLGLCLSAGAPLPVEVKEAFERLAHTRLLDCYGLAEAGPFTHANPRLQPRTGSIGLPLPGVTARICGLDDGAALPHGAPGELVVGGPGWGELATGDLALMDDDGYFFLLGRVRDAWQDADGWVFPRDIEETLFELPPVNEAVALRRPDGRVAAYLRLEPGKTLSAAEALAFCARRLPPRQQPAEVVFVEQFPRDAAGRVDRASLAALAGDSPN